MRRAWLAWYKDTCLFMQCHVSQLTKGPIHPSHHGWGSLSLSLLGGHCVPSWLMCTMEGEPHGRMGARCMQNMMPSGRPPTTGPPSGFYKHRDPFIPRSVRPYTPCQGRRLTQNVLLERIAVEPMHLVRRAVADVASVVAKVAVPEGTCGLGATSVCVGLYGRFTYVWGSRHRFLI